MKSKRRWLLLIFPLALFIWAYQAASWRPKLIGVQPTFAGNELKPIPPGLLQGTGASAGFRLLVSPDAKLLASSGSDNQSNFVMLWDTVSRQRKWQIKRDFNAWLNPLAFSPDSRTLSLSESFINSNEFLDKIILLDVSTGKRRRDISYGFAGTLQSAAFLSNRQLVISTSQSAIVVDTQTGKAIRQWKFELPVLLKKLPSFNQSHVAADGATVIALANGTSDTAIAIYDVKTGKRRGVWTYKGVFRNPRLSPDGTLWAVEREKNDSIDVYDARTGQKLWGPFEGNQTNAPWAWSADSQRLALPKREGVSLFDARKQNFLGYVSGASGNRALTLSPNGDYLYTLDDTGKIWRWRAR